MANLANRERGESSKPTIVGSGLLALDIVISEVSDAPPRLWAGGTCGNVLLALRYLGWESRPVARLRPGVAADRILADLRRWGVSDQFVTLAEDGSTPVIVERISRSSAGDPKHSFSWRCPVCNAPFPGFKPVLSVAAEEVANAVGDPEVYFFDRATPAGIALARVCAGRGSLVVFEPSSIGNPILFRQAWETSHVVKYSHERLRELPEIGVEGIPQLEVETHGEAGLRYRRVIRSGRSGRWNELDAFRIGPVRDTAGSGDWCTAGFLQRVGQEGANGLLKLTAADIREALRYGQALAAWNCQFEGARGGMYTVEFKEFVRQVREILAGGGHVGEGPQRGEGLEATLGGVCAACVQHDAIRTSTGT